MMEKNYDSTMEKCYLIVVNLNNKHYVQLAKSDSGYSLSAFKEKKEALSQFDRFKDKAMSSSYETHISGSMGVISLNPHIIEVPKDNPKELQKYLVDGKPKSLKGSGGIGVFVDMVGAEVDKKILELSVCDVSKEIIDEVYNR